MIENHKIIRQKNKPYLIISKLICVKIYIVISTNTDLYMSLKTQLKNTP